MIKIWTVEDAGFEALESERRRLQSGPSEADRQLGLVREEYIVACSGNATDVLQRARSVMETVINVSLSGTWPTDDEWPRRLPAWFVDACKREDAEEKNQVDPDWYDIPQEERRARALAEKWKLASWTYWMEPSERKWMWWDGELWEPNLVRVEVDRLGDPSDLGSPPGLWWLFAASGATEYDHIFDWERRQARHLRPSTGPQSGCT
jgi:hypothetical protein